MTSPEPLAAFITTSFRSVWALELLLHLRDRADRSWGVDELVEVLRGSALIVTQSLDALMRAGLVSVDQDARAHFQPASEELARLTAETENLYRRRPDTVRRIIVSGRHTSLASFADAFRLRKD